MKPLVLWFCVILLAGCTTADMPDMSPPPPDNPPMPTGGPNWQNVDRTVERMRQRDGRKPAGAAIAPKKMTEAQYDAALKRAREEIRQANPQLSDTQLEWRAIQQADAEKAAYESGAGQNAPKSAAPDKR